MLINFWRKVRPAGPGWTKVREMAGAARAEAAPPATTSPWRSWVGRGLHRDLGGVVRGGQLSVRPHAAGDSPVRRVPDCRRRPRRRPAARIRRDGAVGGAIMRRRTFLRTIGSVAAMSAAPRAASQWQESQRYPDPRIQIIDQSFARYRIASAKVERLATGMRWARGRSGSATAATCSGATSRTTAS